MPSFSVTTLVRNSAEGLQLALTALHVLVLGAPSGTVYAVKGRVPHDVDVILESDLVITLSGTLNRVEVDARTLQSSAIAQHLQNYFRMNGEQLGLRIASKLAVDKSDGKVKLTLSPTRPILERRASSLHLSTLQLLYACRTPHPVQSSIDDLDAHMKDSFAPFSPHAFLPLVSALDRIVEKFVCLHLVGRYPLIFGPWRERFDAEVNTSAKIVRAITDIISRSPHASFRKRCRGLLKTLRKKCAAASDESVTSLQTLLRDVAVLDLEDVECRSPPLEYCDILREAMDCIFRCGMKPTPYKGAPSGGNASIDIDDDIALSTYRANSPASLVAENGSSAHGLAVEIWFGEDIETVSCSEEDDLFIEPRSDLGDVDIWVSDEAESVRSLTPLLEDLDSLGGSSQSTLDESMFDAEEVRFLGSESYQSATSFAAFSDPCPRVGPLGLVISDDDVWVDYLACYDQDAVRESESMGRCPPQSSQKLEVDSSQRPPFVDRRNTATYDFCCTNPLPDPTTSAGLGSHPVSSSYAALSLEAVTSYLPVTADDDLAWDSDAECSGAFFPATSWRCSAQEGTGVPVQQSPDGRSLSSQSRSEYASLGFAELASTENFAGASIRRFEGLTSVRRSTEDEGIEHGGDNAALEASLIVGDGCHAWVTRSGEVTARVNGEEDAEGGEPDFALEFDAVGDDAEMMILEA